MSNMLKAGERLRDASTGKPVSVLELLGDGGQGEVYRVSFAGTEYAAKWYFPSTATPLLRSRIERLVEKGAPNDKFLWPLSVLVKDGSNGFGYLMPLRESRYSGLSPVVRGKARATLTAVATAGIQLSDSFLQLHHKGLCYCDISFGNIFLDPRRGDIAICDNDNVTVNRDKNMAVLGTMRFMAPEVVRGESLPGTQTDLYSLAVFFFYMLMREHPLHGKKESSVHCMDDPAALEIYGKNPVFMFDPKDRSNEPHPEYHAHVELLWRLCPSYLRRLFLQSFTDGIRDPDRRVRESEWRSAFCRWRDTMVDCAACGTENSFDDSAKSAAFCWAPECGKALTAPVALKIGSITVTCRADRKLYRHHLDGSYDFSMPIAEVTPNPKDPNVKGLKNLSTAKWVVTLKDGRLRDIEPGRTISLEHARSISFGAAEGRFVHYAGSGWQESV